MASAWLLLGATAGGAAPPEGRARLIPAVDPARRLKEVSWDPEGALIRQLPNGTELVLKGRYKQSAEATLALGGKPVVPAPETGDFQVVLPVDPLKPTFEVVLVDKLGKTRKETITFVLPPAPPAESSVEPAKTVFFNGGLGLSLISYSEAGAQDVSQTALTAKFSVSRSFFSPRWDFGLTTYVTAVALSHTSKYPGRFFGFNLRGGYHFTDPKSPLAFTLMGGLYYATTFVDDNSFGYKDIAGPQLFPVVRKTFRNGDFASGYFKISPVASSFSILSFANRELALGVSYAFALKGGDSVSVSVDYSNLALEIPTEVGTFQAASSAFTLGAGYGF